MVKDPEGEPDLAGFKNKGMCQEHADETFKRSTGHFTINEFLRYVIKDPNIWLMLDKQQGFSDETLDEIEDVRIIQPKKGHRFTTDSVLLARLSTPKKYAKVLELGTGCGIVSIILSKRIPSLRITAVEIQEELAKLAERNVILNNMEPPISVLNRDIKELPKILPSAHFDYIITNPPYRPPASGRTSPDRKRAISNHEFSVTINDIMKVSRHLLKVRGRISLIYTADRLADLFSAMRRFRIEPKEMRCILTNKEGVIRLVWVEGIREGKSGLNISYESRAIV